MTQVFGPSYSTSYDTLYDEKDYQAECDLIEKLLQEHEIKPVRTILDLGCGTGNHAIPLSERGYQVFGVDRSEDMLAQARKKAQAFVALNDQLQFQLGDIRELNLQQTFDTVLMMFAVLGYQIENNDVLDALRTARKHLGIGGLFIFDVWYGPAVLNQRPSERLKILRAPAKTLLRAASGKLDVYSHTCEVEYQMWQIEGERLTSEAHELHTMRYFFPQELKLFLETVGFQLKLLQSFDAPHILPTETTWNILCTATAV